MTGGTTGSTTGGTASGVPDDSPEAAAALDMLLTQAALGPLRRFFPGRAALRLAWALAGQPGLAASRAGGLAAELARVIGGSSGVAPGKRDRRFADPAWTGNPVLRRVMQAYLASGDAALGLVNDIPLDWRDAERLRFAVSNLVDALAPSNSVLSPEAVKAALDSGGGSLLTGARHLLNDLASTPRVPAMVPPDAYSVGTDLATTPGAVVLRTPSFELIQYRPATETVRELPVLIVPPTINKYYVLDLAPGRSLIEYLVSQGQQVFVMSWRNPDKRHASWGFDDYTRAIIEAVDTAADICGAAAAHLLGGCSGGILASLAAAVQAAGAAPGAQPRIASLGLLVTMLDQSRTDAGAGGGGGAAAGRGGAGGGGRRGAGGGRLDDGCTPARGVWGWILAGGRTGVDRRAAPRLRPRGRVPPRHPGGLTVLGTEIDLAQVDLDSYVVAGVAALPESGYRGASGAGGRPGLGCSPAAASRGWSPPGKKASSGKRGVTADARPGSGPPPRSRGRGGGSPLVGRPLGGQVPARASLGRAASRHGGGPGGYVRAA